MRIVFKPTWSAVSSAIRGKVEAIRQNKAAMWWLSYVGRWALVALVLVAWSLVMMRAGQKKALAEYHQWMEAYRVERMQIDQAYADADPYKLQLDAEAESLARVLYGVKDNDAEDMRTYCWCVFNRVDNTAFPDALEDVIAQPSQWMRYDPTNPVLENLFQIAREELEAWHSDGHRPCSADYVFMSWSPSDICLRDRWAEGSGCHYWRYGQ